jgi:hypothetical protein
MDSRQYKDSLMLSWKHMWQLLAYLLYKNFMSNKEIFHSLQEFHIHYGMYMEYGGKEAWDSFVVLFLILRDFLTQKKDYEKLFKWDISTTFLSIL